MHAPGKYHPRNVPERANLTDGSASTPHLTDDVTHSYIPVVSHNLAQSPGTATITAHSSHDG
eukprot:3516390-Prymnesium_polylepis.1